jgi:putative exosortase-associated protein (TIGR04073 family)
MGMRSAWRVAACAAVLVVGAAASASAAIDETKGGPSYVSGSLRKLGRGISNVVTCPIELPRTIERVSFRDGYVAAATVGVLQGVWRTILRGVVGLFEVATFPAEIPKGFEPLIKPEFAFGRDVWDE